MQSPVVVRFGMTRSRFQLEEWTRNGWEETDFLRSRIRRGSRERMMCEAVSDDEERGTAGRRMLLWETSEVDVESREVLGGAGRAGAIDK